jgi:hypothetical protein
MLSAYRRPSRGQRAARANSIASFRPKTRGRPSAPGAMQRAQPIHRVNRYDLLARRPSHERPHPSPPVLRRTPQARGASPAGRLRYSRA